MYPDYQRLTGNSWSRQTSQNADQIKKNNIKNHKKHKNQKTKKKTKFKKKKTIDFYQPWVGRRECMQDTTTTRSDRTALQMYGRILVCFSLLAYKQVWF
jgi:hypothetical protein